MISQYILFLYLISMYISNKCACKKQSLLFDLFNVFDQIESSHKSDVFFSQNQPFICICAQPFLSYHTIYLSTIRSSHIYCSMPHTIFNVDDNVALTENYLFDDGVSTLVR